VEESDGGELLDGPAASEEPQFRGSRRVLNLHLDGGSVAAATLARPVSNPLRRSITQGHAGGASSAARKSLASTGPYSLYSNKAFQKEVGSLKTHMELCVLPNVSTDAHSRFALAADESFEVFWFSGPAGYLF
jgi:hypothetical protein